MLNIVTGVVLWVLSFYQLVFVIGGGAELLEAQTEVVSLIVMVTEANLVLKLVGLGPRSELERAILVIVGTLQKMQEAPDLTLDIALPFLVMLLRL